MERLSRSLEAHIGNKWEKNHTVLSLQHINKQLMRQRFANSGITIAEKLASSASKVDQLDMLYTFEQ